MPPGEKNLTISWHKRSTLRYIQKNFKICPEIISYPRDPTYFLGTSDEIHINRKLKALAYPQSENFNRNPWKTFLRAFELLKKCIFSQKL